MTARQLINKLQMLNDEELGLEVVLNTDGEDYSIYEMTITKPIYFKDKVIRLLSDTEDD